MTLPDRDVAVTWVGRTLIDRDGVEIGACTAVFADDATQRAEWVCAELAGVAVLLPAVGATESGGQVRLVVGRADIDQAPPIDVERHISIDDEATLYRHYGIPHSSDESPTVIPTAEPDAGTTGTTDISAAGTTDPTAAGTTDPTAAGTTDALSTGPADTDTDTSATGTGTDSRSAGPADTLTAAGPTDTPDASLNGRYDAPGEPDTTPDAPRRGPKLASAGAGLALAAAAVLGVRRLRRRPRTRTERLADRGRVASAVLGARTAKLAAAAPEVTTRRPARTGAVLTAVAAALAAVRRRRSHTPDEPSPTTR